MVVNDLDIDDVDLKINKVAGANNNDSGNIKLQDDNLDTTVFPLMNKNPASPHSQKFHPDLHNQNQDGQTVENNFKVFEEVDESRKGMI